MDRSIFKFDPKLDLVFERVVDIPPKLVWEAWTTPEHIKHWFTPAPWKTVDCEIDLRSGGIFRTLMRSPEGKDFPTMGSYLEVTPDKRLIWTDALGPGFRPSLNSFITAVIELEPVGSGTRYTATLIHKDEANRKKHEEIGFYEGWGKALDQLVAHMKKTANI